MKFQLPRIKWRFQFSLFTLLGVVTLVAIGLGIAPAVRVLLAMRALSNRDVEVDGTYIGLMVDNKSPSAEKLKLLGTQANRALERALADPERFAAAHILLTEINQRRYSISASHWNDMEITLYADGRVDFHAEQIPKLQEFWRKRLGKNPPPAK